MHRKSLTAWAQFEMMLRAGVPHATDIAAELARHNLLSPLATTDQSQQADLQFYSVIHRAYKVNVLPAFLNILERLKGGRCWSPIRNSQDLQLWIVQQCIECQNLQLSEAEDRIQSYLFSSNDLSMKIA